jgi:hypothetical protein
LPRFNALSASGTAPAGWHFNASDFWIEEHGLIMEAPQIPIVNPGRAHAAKYVVTGDREVTTTLTIEPDGRWSLASGTLYDVTHLPCRSARYTGAPSDFAPSTIEAQRFPVPPGAAMPPLSGCAHRDYAVLFIVGVERAVSGGGAREL